MHASIVAKKVIDPLNAQNPRRQVVVEVLEVLEEDQVLVSIVAKKVIDQLNVPNRRKLVVENNRMHVSIAVKMVTNHLNVQNRKKVDHRSVQVVAVELVVELVVPNVISVVIQNIVRILAMLRIKRSNLMTTMNSFTNGHRFFGINHYFLLFKITDKISQQNKNKLY